MCKLFTLFLSIVLCGTFAFGQSHIVKGKVSGPDGTALPGISVEVQGTTMGTTTDANGEYQLSIVPNSTLVFSGIGYDRQSINIGDRTVVNVTLTIETTTLNAVVVTALGISR